MKSELTIAECLFINKHIADFFQEKHCSYSAVFAFDLKSIQKAIGEHIEKYQDTQKELLGKVEHDVKSDGSVKFKKTGDEDKFIKDMNEVLNKKVKVKLPKITRDDLSSISGEGVNLLIEAIFPLMDE